jgi:hypothetical protein
MIVAAHAMQGTYSTYAGIVAHLVASSGGAIVEATWYASCLAGHDPPPKGRYP